jgi:hypothetical protein
VQSQYQRGAFAYSKWELTAGHTLYTAMGEMMSTKEVRSALARTTGLAPATSTTADTALGDITDYFVTARAVRIDPRTHTPVCCSKGR